MPLSTVHNIIKGVKESGEIYMETTLKGGQPKINSECLRACRQHCIKNRYDSVMEIPAWTQEDFQNHCL